MISEPEMVPDGHFGAAELPEQQPSPDDVVSAGDGPAAARPSRPAWLWALGGAVVASAVWAAGLYVYTSRDPDLGGYRTSRNLCAEAEFKALTATLGKRVGEGSAWGNEHESLDEAWCYTDLKPTGYVVETDEEGNELGSLPHASVSYTLHKRTDPGPEFDGWVVARSDGGGDEEAETGLRRIDGLGERAFVHDEPGGGSATLHVLDGQAVLTLTVGSDWDPESGEALTDVSELEPILVEDMRALMAKLKS
ncbi:hypothetical protein [Streptomyces peucetius]|uniref:DUF3558 domain-containing protein n=1 Tax=Streptomyces peucetius TaxID=1950 RepID=A0ABY6IBP9_STRPE|nr:hypothetical protein [Streptomyces peucetius]UYQ64149.1 hypothetical protein OGH68_23565 [Streptomyces peucetius]